MAAVANTLHKTVGAVLVPFPNNEEIITMLADVEGDGATAVFPELNFKGEKTR